MTKVQDIKNSKTIRVGSYLYAYGQTYQVVALKTNGLSVENIANFETKEFSLFDLYNDQKAEVVFASNRDELRQIINKPNPLSKPVATNSLPSKFLLKANEIISNVELVAQQIDHIKTRKWRDGDKFSYTEAVNQACTQLTVPISKSTYYAHLKLYQQHAGDRNQIAASFRRATFDTYQMPESSIYFVDTVLDFYYLKEPSPSPSYIYNVIKSIYTHTCGYWIDPKKCGKQVPDDLISELFNDKLPFQTIFNNPEKVRLLSKIDLPARTWFYCYVRWYESRKREVVVTRYGQETYDRFFNSFDAFVTIAQTILHYVFADHFFLDVLIVDGENRSTTIRLWATLLIDVYSRSILGISVSTEAPSIMSIQSALFNAIWSKTLLKDYGIEGEWICYGIPLNLSLDNALAHHSQSLENLARQISRNNLYNSIALDFRPTYKGRYGAIIERCGLKIQHQIREDLLGALPVNPKPKDIAKARDKACLLYEDLYRYLLKEIVAYQHTPHTSLAGMTPHQKWLEGLQNSLPLVPSLTNETKRLFWREHLENRHITEHGIRVFGMRYYSSDLANAVRITKDGKRMEYSIKYNPDDISLIALFREGTWICDLRAKELRQADGS